MLGVKRNPIFAQDVKHFGNEVLSALSTLQAAYKLEEPSFCTGLQQGNTKALNTVWLRQRTASKCNLASAHPALDRSLRAGTIRIGAWRILWSRGASTFLTSASDSRSNTDSWAFLGGRNKLASDMSNLSRGLRHEHKADCRSSHLQVPTRASAPAEEGNMVWNGPLSNSDKQNHVRNGHLPLALPE